LTLFLRKPYLPLRLNGEVADGWASRFSLRLDFLFSIDDNELSVNRADNAQDVVLTKDLDAHGVGEARVTRTGAQALISLKAISLEMRPVEQIIYLPDGCPHRGMTDNFVNWRCGGRFHRRMKAALLKRIQGCAVNTGVISCSRE